MSRRTLLFIRWGVFMAACAFLYLRLARLDDPAHLARNLGSLEAGTLFRTGALVLVLMLLNWSLEALKWRSLVRGLAPMSFSRSFVATIAGTSIGMITPNRVGEFAGRVLFLEPRERIRGAFITTVGSIAQFVVTLIMGTVGLVVLFGSSWTSGGDPQGVAWIGVCAILSAGILLLYFHPDLLRSVIAHLPIIRKWSKHAEVLEDLRSAHLLSILFLSVLRYAVFTTQFVILLALFGGIGPQASLTVVPVAFLFSTLIPTVMLTELGVRGSVAVALISPSAGQDQGVLIASTVLWAVNVALPAVAGACILLVARIRAGRA